MIIFLFQIRNQKLKEINRFPKISGASEQKTLGVSKSQILFFFHCHSVVITNSVMAVCFVVNLTISLALSIHSSNQTE